MSGAAIVLDGVSKRFGRGRRRVQALRDLSLTVAPAQVYGFLGPNGAGKSTTIRILMDLIRPTSGEAYLFDRPVRQNPALLARRVGSLVEGASFYGFLSARDNLAVLADTGGRRDDRQIDELLERVGLSAAANQRVKGYSTGMKQRLGLAAALLHDPELVILDEPTNGLDPVGMKEVRTFIRDLVDVEGKTVFLSSHLLGEVEQVCDRVAIIHRGELVREGSVAALLGHHTQIRLEVEPLETARSLLAEQWPVRQEGEWLVVDATREAVPELQERLLTGRCRVFQISIVRQSLEEYFLEAVGEEQPV
jgi:ABC-2 type transport system ATP-binding protein